MLIKLYKIGGVHFRLLGTNGFRIKAKKERFTASSSRCRQNLKYENFTSSFVRLRQNIAPKSVPHVQHDYFSSFNQSNHWLVALSLTLPSSNLKLPIPQCERGRKIVLLIAPGHEICKIAKNEDWFLVLNSVREGLITWRFRKFCRQEILFFLG